MFAVFLATATASPPLRQTAGAAGYDLHASETVTIPAGGMAWVPTGVHVSLPPNTVGLVKSRSSLSKLGAEVGAGVIDSDYRGEIKVKVFVHASSAPVTILQGQRFAQLLLLPHIVAEVKVVARQEDLGETERGEGGFGSTGVGGRS